MASNSLFPKSGQIFSGSVDKLRNTVARPSLDTFYQVNFSFGNWQTWFGNSFSGNNRTQGLDFMEKMSILCTQAEIPGTQFTTSTTTGHHQGIVEEFPNLRNFPPLNLVFYVDADHVILQVLESWMTYINPVQTTKRTLSAFTRFNYPEDYKEIIHVTKFERDTFIKEPKRFESGQSKMMSYEFVNAWPTNLTSMRVAYGDSNVLRCAVQFAYDRFFTSFDRMDGVHAPINTPLDITNANDNFESRTFGRNLVGSNWVARDNQIRADAARNFLKNEANFTDKTFNSLDAISSMQNER